MANDTSAYEHKPVMLEEVLDALRLQPDGCYVDGTFGRGGHSRAILRSLDRHGRLFAVDRDVEAIAAADPDMLADPRFTLRHGSYTMLTTLIAEFGLQGKVNGVLFDLGVSSPQLDEPARGFSFSRDGALDMRMDRSGGQTAAAWLRTAAEREIVEVLRRFGEERYARRIARAIIIRRRSRPLKTTADLTQLIEDTVPTREKHKHPATRAFQAIRIHINRELEELGAALGQAVDVLIGSGRLVVISFHSLEDRLVKRFMRNAARGGTIPPEIPLAAEAITPALRIIGRAIRPSAGEVRNNPRARSATLRVAERIR